MKSFPTILISALLPAVLAVLLASCTADEKPEEVDGLVTLPPNIPTGPAGTFLEVGDLIQARKHHGASMLPSGDILVSGGEDGTGTLLASAEFYDYDQGEFLGAPFPMLEVRAEFGMNFVAGDDNILITGGRGASGVLATAELFDPASYQFTATAGPLNTGRRAHAAVVLPNSNVFLCGGVDASGTTLDSCEIYDRANGVFVVCANPLSTPRASHTATLLDNGKLLVAGGFDASGNVLTSAEIFDPGTGMGDQGTFAVTGSLPVGRARHLAVKVNLGAYWGQVAVLGGVNGSQTAPMSLNSGAAFDPTDNGHVGAFTPMSSIMSMTRVGFTATMLTGGTRMLIVGGNTQNLPEILDPYANGLATGMGADAAFVRTKDGVGTDTAQTTVTQGRTAHTASWLLNGTILLCGGEDGGTVIAKAEIYNP